MSIFGCLITGFISIFLFVFVLIGGVINAILRFLGLRQPRKEQSQQSGAYGNPFGQQHSQRQASQQQTQTHQERTHTGQQKAKIFERNANEYVDFEEVK